MSATWGDRSFCDLVLAQVVMRLSDERETHLREIRRLRHESRLLRAEKVDLELKVLELEDRLDVLEADTARAEASEQHHREDRQRLERELEECRKGAEGDRTARRN